MPKDYQGPLGLAKKYVDSDPIFWSIEGMYFLADAIEETMLQERGLQDADLDKVNDDTIDLLNRITLMAHEAALQEFEDREWITYGRCPTK